MVRLKLGERTMPYNQGCTYDQHSEFQSHVGNVFIEYNAFSRRGVIDLHVLEHKELHHVTLHR